MTVGTLGLAVVLTVAVYAVRAHWRTLRSVWSSARWWEKLLLLLALAPVPGPFEEVVGFLVVRRVIARGVRR